MSHEQLVRKRGTVKAKLTNLEKYIINLEISYPDYKVDDFNIFLELEQRVDRFQSILDEFEDPQGQIEEISDNLEAQYVERETFEKAYFSVLARAKRFLINNPITSNDNGGSSQGSTRSSGSGTKEGVSGVKLPVIEIMSFNGEFDKWLEFRDTYQSLIHQNSSLSQIQKYHYLRAYLGASVLEIIASLEFSASNYESAWKLICDRFNNSRILIQNHVKALFTINKIETESSCDLRKLVDSVAKHLRALKTLNEPTESWDTLVIYLVTTKLDEVTHRKWEQLKASYKTPTLEQLSKFLKERADLLESLGQSNDSQPSDRQPKKRSKVLLANSEANSFLSNYSSNKPKCSFCKRDHYIQVCSDFLKLNLSDRVEQAKKKRLCLNCLRSGHIYKQCYSGPCKSCKLKHHTLLHKEGNNDKANNSESLSNDKDLQQESVNLSSHNVSNNQQVLLSTALVSIVDKNNKIHKARALLDAGSQSSFLTERFCADLNLHKLPVDVKISGFNETQSQCKGKCVVRVQSKVNKFSTEICCLIVPQITGNLPNFKVHKRNLKFPENVKLADPCFDIPGDIDMLIGADHFWDLMCVGQVKLSSVGPYLQKTKFGWVVSGPIENESNHIIQCNLLKHDGIDKQLTRFWEIEEFPGTKPLSFEEKACERHFLETFKRDSSERFVVTIPLVENTERLGDSYDSAEKRLLSLERKFDRNDGFKTKYFDFIREYIRLGHMSKVEHSDENNDISKHAYYMPHHGVLKESSLTTKLRVVFDASCPSSTGYSFNDLQMTGPTIQSDLLSILLRHRKHNFVIAADVEKMYRMCLINPDQKCFQRILWRDDPKKPIDTYELLTVTYGTKSAAFLAIRCLYQLGIECETMHPLASQVIKEDFYVDDMLTGSDTVENTISLANEVSMILSKAGFHLRKWVSNSAQVLQGIQVSDNADIIDLGANENTKTLGYHHTTQQPPRITEHPVDTTVARHEPATLNCQAQGSPEPSITWYKDGAILRTTVQDSRSHRVVLPAGNLFFLKVVQSRKESDAGVYWCEANNALGKVRSRNATLTVAILRDDFRLEPQSGRVAAGEDIVMECAPPRGTPEPHVFWRRDGQTLELGGRLKLVDGFNLAITDSKPSDDGRYQCVAKNTAGIRESSIAILKVYVKPFMIRPPEDITSLVGSKVEFPCAVGGDPVPDVLWRRQAPGGTMPLGRVRVLEDRTLRLENLNLLDQGRYTCDADNFAGAISASAFLTVFAPPIFTTRPLAQTVETGQQVSFHCHVTGSPKPLIFWSFEGDRTLIYPGSPTGNFEAFTSVEGQSSLILKNAQVQNSGTVIICSGVNEAGSVSTRTRLTVTSKEDRPPPVITRGPSNQTLPIYSVAYLICEATGIPKPVISWYKEGVPVTASNLISMANPGQVEIYNLSKEDSGAYTCVASSRGGKATWTGHLLVENPKNPNINFFKAPEAVMLPGPPSRPHALNQSEGSVTITWGQNNKIGSSSLLGYQVELFGRENGVTPTWTIVASRVPGPTFTQHLLSPGVPYTFLVRAENSHGLGPPSPLSEPVIVGPDLGQNWGNPEVTILSEARASLVTTPNIVKLIDAMPMSSMAVKLAWDVTDSTFVEGLYIYYVSIDGAPDTPRSYSMLTVLHTGGSSSFTVNNLDKWSIYKFFLIPFYKAIEGQPSNSKTVRTLEDVPNEAPTSMEALLLNSTAVKLKWKPPQPVSLNGELEGYKLQVKSNDSVVPNVISVGSVPAFLLGNLSSGVLYYVQVAASTRAGVGPFSPASTLRLDPATRVMDNNIQRPIGPNMQSDNFVTETWFMALLISMISVMVILFAAMFFVRRRQLLSKKTMTPSRSNGGVLNAPQATKQEAPLWLDKNIPDYATTFPEYSKLTPNQEYSQRNEYSNGSLPQSNGKHLNGNINLHTNPLHFKEQYSSRPDKLEYGSENGYPAGRKFNDYNLLQVQEYASPNVGNDRGSQIADYAEVDATLANNNDGGNTSPAPYATTTLVTGSRRLLWNSPSLSTEDESPYPASNGGYYNRKVYSDSYFAPAHTLRRSKKDHHSRKNSQESNPPDLVSPNGSQGQPVYARVGPPALSWRNGAPGLSSFTSGATRHAYHGSSRSEPGNML